jgi:hypothetical protein
MLGLVIVNNADTILDNNNVITDDYEGNQKQILLIHWPF